MTATFRLVAILTAAILLAPRPIDAMSESAETFEVPLSADGRIDLQALLAASDGGPFAQNDQCDVCILDKERKGNGE